MGGILGLGGVSEPVADGLSVLSTGAVGSAEVATGDEFDVTEWMNEFDFEEHIEDSTNLDVPGGNSESDGQQDQQSGVWVLASEPESNPYAVGLAVVVAVGGAYWLSQR